MSEFIPFEDWTTEELIKTLEFEKETLSKEIIKNMKEELKKRNIAKSQKQAILTEIKEPNKRPRIISIICVIVFITIPLSLFVIQYTPLGLLLLLSTFISFIGYWLMKKWGVYLYTGTFVMGIATSLEMQFPLSIRNIIGILVQIFIIGTGFYYLKQMR